MLVVKEREEDILLSYKLRSLGIRASGTQIASYVSPVSLCSHHVHFSSTDLANIFSPLCLFSIPPCCCYS